MNDVTLAVLIGTQLLKEFLDWKKAQSLPIDPASIAALEAGSARVTQEWQKTLPPQEPTE